MPAPKSDAARVNSPGFVDADEPTSAEPDPARLRDAMQKAAQGDPNVADKLDDQEALKREVASGSERQNDAGN